MRILLKTILLYFFTLSVYAGDSSNEVVKNHIKQLNNFTAESISSFFTGPGETEVSITGIENKKPEISILLVRPFFLTQEDTLFSQISFNHYYVRNDERVAINLGIGYRKIFNNNFILGGNIFFDADDEDNTRSSIGLELKSNSFEAYINYYAALSGATKVGVNIERVLDGYDAHAIGQVPFLPWAKIHYRYFDWDAEKYTTDTDGHDLSLEMLITKNILLEVGYSDNNISSADGFGAIKLVFPGEEGVSAFEKLFTNYAFPSGAVNHLLLTKVERQNRMKIETVSEGVVIGRLD